MDIFRSSHFRSSQVVLLDFLFRISPMRAAAPFGHPTRQLVSFGIRIIAFAADVASYIVVGDQGQVRVDPAYYGRPRIRKPKLVNAVSSSVD
jgi:hypothetical protein